MAVDYIQKNANITSRLDSDREDGNYTTETITALN